MRQLQRSLAVAAIALLVLAALAPAPAATVTECVTLLPVEIVATAPAEPRDARPQPVALLALTLLRAPPIA